jgi:phosphonate utilization transcriptional regulator PhnR
MQYVKIKDALVEQIESGLLAAGQKLPAERKLAEAFDTTRVTLREALSILEAQGAIFREDRRGWFISPPRLKYDPAQPLPFNQLALSQNRKPVIEVLNATTIMAGKQAASLLQLAPFSDVYCLNRVRYLDQRPIAYVTSYIKADMFPELLSHDLSSSLTDILRTNYATRYANVQYRIVTTSLIGDVSQALRATSGLPAVLVERVHRNEQGDLVDCHFEYWRHDAISIESMA